MGLRVEKGRLGLQRGWLSRSRFPRGVEKFCAELYGFNVGNLKWQLSLYLVVEACVFSGVADVSLLFHQEQQRVVVAVCEDAFDLLRVP